MTNMTKIGSILRFSLSLLAFRMETWRLQRSSVACPDHFIPSGVLAKVPI
jgi:hypothetical protein